MSKKVLCSECGFLCWYVSDESGERTTEVGTVLKFARKEFQNGESKGRGEIWDSGEYCDLGCVRGLWHWTYSKNANLESVNAEELRKLRGCSYYLRFEPGFSPEEHKELKRESDARKATRDATLLGAGIGAAAAIVAQLIYAWLTR